MTTSTPATGRSTSTPATGRPTFLRGRLDEPAVTGGGSRGGVVL